MGILELAKKLARRTYSDWGAEDGRAGFPSEGHGVSIPTYGAPGAPDGAANVIQMAQEQWKEAVNG